MSRQLAALLLASFSLAAPSSASVYRGLCRSSGDDSYPPFPSSQLPYVRFKWPSTLATASSKVEIDVQNVPPSLLPGSEACFYYWYESSASAVPSGVQLGGCVLLQGTSSPPPPSTSLFSAQLEHNLAIAYPGVVSLGVSLLLYDADVRVLSGHIAVLNAMLQSGSESICDVSDPSSSSSSTSTQCDVCPSLSLVSSLTTFSYVPFSDDFSSSESFPSGPSFSSHPLVMSLRSSYDLAVQGSSSLPPSVLSLPGMSGSSFRHFINNLLSALPGSPTYLEVGVWGGSSFIAALHGNSNVKTATAIDNWSQYGGPKARFMENVQEFVQKSTEVVVVERDCWSLSPAELSQLSPVDVYFFDGPHEVSDHLRALLDYFPLLSSDSVVLVDDWNFVDVRVGTERALKLLPVDVLYERTITTTTNDKYKDSLWHNGLKILVLRKRV